MVVPLIVCLRVRLVGCRSHQVSFAWWQVVRQSSVLLIDRQVCALDDYIVPASIGRPVNLDSGPCAMAAYLNEPVMSCLVLDVSLPGRQRSRFADTHCYRSAGLAHHLHHRTWRCADDSQGIKAGAVEFLTKPFDDVAIASKPTQDLDARWAPRGYRPDTGPTSITRAACRCLSSCESDGPSIFAL